jgi:hypothetical protein
MNMTLAAKIPINMRRFSFEKIMNAKMISDKTNSETRLEIKLMGLDNLMRFSAAALL